MTFLEGVQKLARECELASQPDSVLNQTGEFLNVIGWYQDAYDDIQARNDWRWMHHRFYFDTVASDSVYAYTDITDEATALAISRFRKWDIQNVDDPPKSYLASSGAGAEYWLTYVPWGWFRTIYRIGTQAEGPPQFITMDPQDNIVVGPTPDGVYRISGQYHRGNQTLSADADVPDMPADYHSLIWRTALFTYGYKEAAPEVVNLAETMANKSMRQLERTQSQQVITAEPMV